MKSNKKYGNRYNKEHPRYYAKYFITKYIPNKIKGNREQQRQLKEVEIWYKQRLKHFYPSYIK